MKTITLSNGIEIPALGFGTFQITDPKEAEVSVTAAIQAGYRHIDTAQSYMNEEAVGRGIKKSNVARDELFVTTKIWVENTTYERSEERRVGKEERPGGPRGRGTKKKRNTDIDAHRRAQDDRRPASN